MSIRGYYKAAPGCSSEKLAGTSPSDYNGGSIHFKIEEPPVACPYFMPVTKLEGGNWPHPARLPLGSGWSGHCTAPGHEGEIPQTDILEAFCNLGYATSCPWAPGQRTTDAVRFAVAAPAEAGDSFPVGARVLRLVYVCEREHHPVTRGELIFDLSSASWLRRHDDARIQRMAECFLDSYLKRKS